MRHLAAGCALAVVLAGPAAAREAAPRDETRGLVAIRGAVALPVGDVVKDVPIDGYASGAVPIGVELAARGGATTFGLAVEWGPAFVASCRTAPCSGSVTRAGLELLHHFAPRGAVASTWLGFGVGWEGFRVDRAGQKLDLSSFELLNVQLGREVSIRRGISAGPFVAATFAQGMQLGDKDVQRKSPHGWFQLGIRCAFEL